MRKFFIYIAGLTISSVIVFFLVFTFGRSPSLEQEMARRAYRQRGKEALSIPSLRPAEIEEPVEVEELPAPEVVNLTDDVTVTRLPLAEAGVVLLLDGLLAGGDGDGGTLPREEFRRGLEGFFRRHPANVRLGLRVPASEMEADCGETVQLKQCGAWAPSELVGAVRRGEARGPRNISRGLEDAVADLVGTVGERAIIIITGGDERCGGAPCQIAAALQEALNPVRIFVIVLRLPTGYAPYEAMPPPVWQSRMECLAERGRGELFQASTARELEGALLRIASDLQPNVTARAFHAGEREITGVSVENRSDWGVSISPAGASGRESIDASSFPAVFNLPVGEYDLSFRYRGQERVVKGLTISPGERVEIKADFRAGELYLQPKDTAGQELVGDTTDFNCFWGAEVFQEDDLNRDYGASCSFPAHFVLQPGSYTVRVWKGPEDIWLEKVTVEEGETSVETAVFAGE
jgi:hypothetical protein